MKRRFVRFVSGLLVAAMVMGIPVVSMAEGYVSGGTFTLEDNPKNYEIACDHSDPTALEELPKKEVKNTCTRLGYKVYRCDKCGMEFRVYNSVSTAFSHNWEFKAAKYTGDGYDVTFVCSNTDCGKTFKYHVADAEIQSKDDVDALGTLTDPHASGEHVTQTKTVSSNCYEAGYTKTTCLYADKGCTYEMYEYEEPSYDHDWNDWVVTKEPTENHLGTAQHTCSVCGLVEKVALKSLEVTSRLGRVNSDLVEVYNSDDFDSVYCLVGRGATFTYADSNVDGYYEITSGAITDPHDSKNSVGTGSTLWIKKQFVDQVKYDTPAIYCAEQYRNVQKIATVTAPDGQVAVRSGATDVSAKLTSLKHGEKIYVYRVENGWGRISKTENRWVKLEASCLNIKDVYCCSTQLPSLSAADKMKVIDVATITADTAYLRGNAGNKLEQIKKDTKLDLYESLESNKPYKYDDNSKIVQVFVTKTALNEAGYTDAKFDDGGWLDIRDVSLKSGKGGTGGSGTTTKPGTSVVATGTVTSSINLNVRKEPEISVLNLMGSIPTGTKLEFYQIGDANGATWGKIKFNGSYGWVCMTYVQLDAASTGSGSSGTAATPNATVVNCSKAVNVRDAADVSGKLLSTIPLNTRIAVTKLGDRWCFVDGKGWVCMDYVKLDAGAEEAINNANSSKPSGSGNTGAVQTYTNVTVVGKVNAGKSVTVYSSSLGKTGTELRELPADAEFTITDRTIRDNKQWFQVIAAGVTGWIQAEVGTDITLSRISGVVKTTSLNVYENHSQDSKVTRALVNGTEVTIVKDGQYTDGIYVWGQLSTGGWVQMHNLTLKAVVDSSSVGYSVGDVAITGQLKEDATVYKKSNTGSAELFTMKKYQKVTVKYWYDNGTKVMGLVNVGEQSGWIEMDKVNQDAVTATVKVDVVSMYSAKGDLNTKTVHTLRKNDKITVYERALIDTTVWGRVQVNSEADNLWINLAGTSLGTYSIDPTTPPANNSTGNTGNTGSTGSTGSGSVSTGTATGSICNTDKVNVRTAPGVRNTLATTLDRGTPVTVYEQKTVDDALWGRIDQGWVAMSYVDLSSKGNTGNSTVSSGAIGGNTILTSVPSGAVAVGFVNIADLTVRNGAGLGYTKTGTLAKNTNVVIYEQILKDGMIWGRCDKGWICTSYVTITGTSVTGSGTAGTVARCFYTANVRSAPGVANALVGKIMVNSRIEIYEQQSYSGEMWGRTSIGWIAMQYVLTDGSLPIA